MTGLRAGVFLALAACVGQVPDDGAGAGEGVDRATSAIIAGRASGDDENFGVYIESGADDPLRCSGTLVAPNVVVTARHCLLLRRSQDLGCTSEGELVDPSDPRGQDTRVEDAANVRVYYGHERASFASSVSAAVFVANEIALCKNDIAVVVLERPLADVRVPIRLTPVSVGEVVSIVGWGYTDDGQARLPDERYARDGVRVELVGPGLIPPGTFAIPGATTCKGDSGAGARADGALVGVYSRIEGSSCTLAQGRNVFTMTAAHKPLFDRAFAAAETAAWYAGEPPPWLSPKGATCDADATCQSGRCDVDRRVCAVVCEGDADCAEGEMCDGARALCAPAVEASASPPPPPPSPEASSCAMAARVGGRSGLGGWALLSVVSTALLLCQRSRSRVDVR